MNQHSETSTPVAGPILTKPEQFAIEAKALQIYASEQVQAELAAAQAQFGASPLARTESGSSTLERQTIALAFQAALYAANYDTSRPFILWSTNAGHCLNGLEVPSTGYGLDSPDNVYRHATLDGSSRYAIRGTRHGKGPAQQTFVIYRSIPGMSETMDAAGHMIEIAGIRSEVIETDAQGNFTVTIDAEPANGRANHLQVERDLPGLHLMIRDSLADWDSELPIELTIERIDGKPAAPPPDEAAMIEHAARIIRTYCPYWLNWYETYVEAKPLNQVVPPWKRITGWGMTQQGRFALEQDEAWVLTLDPLGAAFFDFQIADPWAKAVEYVERTGSFNASQAWANPDGTLTLVACPSDPGVHNWLDTSGLLSGSFQVRWQGLPDSVTSGEQAVRKVEVVKLARLTSNLPAGTRMLDAQGRAAQLAARKASYENRLR